ncbi:hypothetical protein C8Q75DRAFT_801719 [Abortiporus biennis]|nr:hypothetical protein C8Q75DRAFT_801719 [Abortiporus biennis]
MARKKIKLESEDDQEYIPEEIFEEVSRTPVRRRKGCLKNILSMPIDVVHEIFSHLDPSDLLHLARMTKSFRSFLLSKNSIGIWRSARGNIEGLPDCPPYLSEPAYANLLFSPHCHNCLTGNIHNVIFNFNVRYCAACKKTQTVDSYLLGGRGGYAGGLEADMFSKTMGERRRIIYHKPEVEDIWHTWLSLPEDSEVRERFKQEHRARVQQVQEHAELCNKWLEARKASRSQELTELRKAKVDIVVGKLQALGWEAELEDMKANNYYKLAEHVLVRTTKKMNDKAWEAIRDRIVEFMQTCRKDRLVSQRRKQLKTRLGWLAGLLTSLRDGNRTTSSDLKPHFIDYALMPEFRELGEAPSNAHITKASYEVLRDMVPTFENRWREQIDTQLIHLICTSMNIPFNNDPRYLAILHFDCTSCRRRGLQYPHVIAHDCLHGRYWSPYNDKEDSSYYYEDVAQDVWHSRPWTRNLIVSRVTERAKPVIRAFGKDPLKVSFLDMDDLDGRVICKTCSRSEVSLICGWRTAIEHARTAHSAIDQPGAEWELVSPAITAAAKECEEEHHENLLDKFFDSILWSCGRCEDPSKCRNVVLSRAAEHMRRCHNVQNPTPANGDFYVSADTPPIVKKPVLLFAKTIHVKDLTETECKYLLDGGGGYYPDEDEEDMEQQHDETDSSS